MFNYCLLALLSAFMHVHVVQCVCCPPPPPPPLQRKVASDGEFVSSALLSRLQDEDPSVVTAVLELGEKVGGGCAASGSVWRMKMCLLFPSTLVFTACMYMYMYV